MDDVASSSSESDGHVFTIREPSTGDVEINHERQPTSGDLRTVARPSWFCLVDVGREQNGILSGSHFVAFSRKVKLAYLSLPIFVASLIAAILVLYSAASPSTSWLCLIGSVGPIQTIVKMDKYVFVYTLKQWGAIIPLTVSIAQCVLLMHMFSFDERLFIAILLFSGSVQSIFEDACPQNNRFKYVDGLKNKAIHEGGSIQKKLGTLGYVFNFTANLCMWIGLKFNIFDNLRITHIELLSTKATPISTGTLLVSALSVGLVFQFKTVVAMIRRPQCLVLSRVPRARFTTNMNEVYEIRGKVSAVRSRKSSCVAPDNIPKKTSTLVKAPTCLEASTVIGVVVIEPIDVEAADVGRILSMLGSKIMGVARMSRLQNFTVKHKLNRLLKVFVLLLLIIAASIFSGGLRLEHCKVLPYFYCLGWIYPLWAFLRCDTKILVEILRTLEMWVQLFVLLMSTYYALQVLSSHMLLPYVSIQYFALILLFDDAAYHNNAPHIVLAMNSALKKNRSRLARFQANRIKNVMLIAMISCFGFIWYWAFNGGTPVFNASASTSHATNKTSNGEEASSGDLATFTPISLLFLFTGCQLSAYFHFLYFSVHYPNCFQTNAIPVRRFSTKSSNIYAKRLARYQGKCHPSYDSHVYGVAVSSASFVHKTVLYLRDPSLRAPPTEHGHTRIASVFAK